MSGYETIWGYCSTGFDLLLDGHSNIWALVDCDFGTAGHKNLIMRSFKVVATSSPKTLEKAWFRHASQRALDLIMYLWSDEKLRIARFVSFCGPAQRMNVTSDFLFHVSSRHHAGPYMIPTRFNAAEGPKSLHEAAAMVRLAARQVLNILHLQL